jgi:hypothetical protein
MALSPIVGQTRPPITGGFGDMRLVTHGLAEEISAEGGVAGLDEAAAAA